jgi:hypothetical protein
LSADKIFVTLQLVLIIKEGTTCELFAEVHDQVVPFFIFSPMKAID